MNKKLIFRIIGALASAMIIVSVFIPFINAAGNTTSLWEIFKVTNSIYLPIMIITFGAIGILFFSLNIKTEFAYMSAGALTFFLVVYTIDIINQNGFNMLSIGYYFLLVGTFLIGLMAFFCNLKIKQELEKKEEITTSTQSPILDQIDKLYGEQPIQNNEITPIQPILPEVQTINVPTPLSEQVVVNPIPVMEQQQPIQLQKSEVISLEQQLPPVPDAPNPVVQQFSVGAQPDAPNPVVQQFSVGAQPNVLNPVAQQNSLEQQLPPVPDAPNPVVQQFESSSSNPISQNFLNVNHAQESMQTGANVETKDSGQLLGVPLTNINNSNNTTQVLDNVPNTNSNEVDIFGQPVNK